MSEEAKRSTSEETAAEYARVYKILHGELGRLLGHTTLLAIAERIVFDAEPKRDAIPRQPHEGKEGL